MNIQSAHIRNISGVGDKKAEILRTDCQIQSFEDMLYYAPARYIDRSKVYKIKDIDKQIAHIQFKAQIKDLQVINNGKNTRATAIAYDETGEIELVWFKGLKYLPSIIKYGQEYILFGQISEFNRKLNIIHPEIERYEQDTYLTPGLQAIYPISEKMKKAYINSKAVSKIIQNIFNIIKSENIYEIIPNKIIKQEALLYRYEALYNLHFPVNADMLRKAVYRLKFEELFYIQLNTLKQKFQRKLYFKGNVFTKVGNYLNDFYNHHLPFELTGAQKKVIKEIRHDCGSGIQMNRLLQGDVGSGKTLVALMCMLIALDNNFQACIMAPTEILANQHYESISTMLKDMNVNIALLTGTTKRKDRQQIHETLENGNLQILVGTHALLEDVVQFNNLGLVIIDEQHRFGVAQRAKLWRKNNIPPHILVMTATPIPRTLAMTLYGDLDVSVIDELPPGRKPISTYHAFDARRSEVFAFIAKELAKGRQAYIVYPMIFESETLDYRNLEIGLEEVERYFSPMNYNIGFVHGKLKTEEKDEQMRRFVKNETQILVATTVIEVGVNVPNASVMLIESAERFGLSQLHQLRGRVGRGAEQSYCILMTSYKLSNESRTRIQTMTSTNDGFEIAEADLKLRGPGDIEGTQQSGLCCNLHIANLAKDGIILNRASKAAISILEEDPDLTKEENAILKFRLKQQFPQLQWHNIS